MKEKNKFLLKQNERKKEQQYHSTPIYLHMFYISLQSESNLSDTSIPPLKALHVQAPFNDRSVQILYFPLKYTKVYDGFIHIVMFRSKDMYVII